jgi:hypothetical protein
MYRSDFEGRAIILYPDFTWEESFCAPFTAVEPWETAAGSARHAHGANFDHTVFLFPTTNGVGFHLFDITGVDPRGTATVMDKQYKLWVYEG